ncbi:MAG: glycosyltransferase family 2 protein [Candidatus Promineifilaceae bacterium]
MPEPPIELSIIIVSWNVRDLLQSCLTSIEAGKGGLTVETIVVDSGSSDGSPEMVRERFPSVRLIACQENVGFPKGNNIGLAEANGRYLLLLNPDTEIVGQALSTMAAYLDAHPDVGVVAGQLLNQDGTVQSSRRRFPTVATAFFESTWLQPVAPKSILRRYYVEDIADDETADVDWVKGACLMTRKIILDQVGPLDADYFMYSEELDWCRRIKTAGWRVVYLPEAKIIHYEGKSSEQAVTARHINFQRAKLRYFRKYHGVAITFALRIFLLVNYIWQLALEAFKGLVGHKKELRRQRVRAYWQVIRSGLKPAGY